MALEKVTLQLSPGLLADAQIVASGQDVTIGHLVRGLLRKEVNRRLDEKTPNQKDPPLVETRLTQIFDHAENWQDLTNALDVQGFYLRAQGAGLAIYNIKTGRHVCNTATVGYRYRRLVRRYGDGMPGHPHQFKTKPAPTPPEQDVFDVIERF